MSDVTPGTDQNQKRRAAGTIGFLVIWVGQFVSMLGTGMTNFALSFWIFQRTGEAADLTWAIFFFIAPSILFSPVAGALVDRHNRKLIMILSDLAAGLATVFVLLLFLNGTLQLWHIYLANFVAGTFNAFQFPAYSAAVTLMLPKKQYARASGLISLAGAASQIMAPAFAGALLGLIGLGGIMAIDVATFIIAIGALAFVAIPNPQPAPEQTKQSLRQESLYGFRYIFSRPSLLYLQLIFTSLNFVAMFGFALLAPYILARTGNDELALAGVQSVSAIGGGVGGLLLSSWGGPRAKIHGVLLGIFGASVLGQMLLGIGQTLIIWTAAAFLTQFFLPFINGSNQAIWQSKVPPALQGRVFSVRRLIAQVTAPVATALAGPLADHIFEPAMSAGGSLTTTFGWLVGTGPGAGMGLMLVIAGLIGGFVVLAGYTVRPIRHVEVLLPDFDAVPAVLTTEGASQ